MTGEELRRALRAQVASGAHAIVSALASGPATVLSAQASGGDMQDSLVGHAVELTAGARHGAFLKCCRRSELILTIFVYTDQWRTLHLSRALCHADRSVVLLSDPTRDMSPRQSEPFFQFLREVLRPDQVVAIATTDTSVGALADHVAHLSVERSAGAKFESALLTP